MVIKFEYVACKNCLAVTDIIANTSNKCETCGAILGTLEGASVVFDDLTRVEIARHGGLMDDFIEVPSNKSLLVLHCEWGVVLFDKYQGLKWSCFVGNIVRSVFSSQDEVNIIAGGNRYSIDLHTGKLTQAEP